MTPTIFIDTEDKSTALLGIVLAPLTRRVHIGWVSGSVSSHTVRRRDQIRFYIRHLMIDESLSYGTWGNWVLDNQL